MATERMSFKTMIRASLREDRKQHSMTYPDITRGDVRMRTGLTQQNIKRVVTAHDLQGNNGRFACQHFAHFGNGLHANAVHPDDDIILMQTGLRGRAAL